MKKIKTTPFIPSKYEVDRVSDNQVKISVYPFEPGYAITLAHPLKRLLLSSTVGFAPTAVKFSDATHEFDSIRGVLEDVAQLIVNLKQLRFKLADDIQKVKVDYSFSGPMDVKGADFNNEDIEVVTPEMHFATINSDGKLDISIVVEKGMGYVPSEDIRDDVESGYLPIDAYFMPIVKANYSIENVLVEDNPNFEKIVFDIETTGQVDPAKVFDDAVATMLRQLEVFGAEIEPLESTKKSTEEDEKIKTMLIKIDDLNLSARSHNCLNRSDIKFVGEIAMMSESELAKVKHLGKKSLDEIKQTLTDLGLGLGMNKPDLIESFKAKLEELKG